MRELKVAYMMGGLNRGGAETIMLDVFRNAYKAPYKMIGIHRKDGAYHKEFYTAGPKMVQLAPKLFGYIRYLLKLRYILKKEGITVVHSQHWLDCIYSWLATIGMHIQIVCTYHGFFPMRGIKGVLCRISINVADDVCFVSKFEQDWYVKLIKISPSKCHVLYNAVNYKKIQSAISSGELRKDSKYINLTMVGNFVEVRDHVTLVKALALLAKRNAEHIEVPPFNFYFIGNRSEEEHEIYDECERICKENGLKNVHFLGGRGDVPALLKSVDGFVYSTDHDTFGVAVVEAMAAGLPIVVNDWPVMKEVCGDNGENNVRYFQSRNVEDCANVIAKLLDDLTHQTEEFRKQCTHNIQWIIEKYSIENYCKSMLQIYNQKDI